MKKIILGIAAISVFLMPMALDASAEGLEAGAPVDPETGISLPPGFRATVFADNLGRLRHITIRDDGTLYGAVYNQGPNTGVVALQDTDGDGRADVIEYFGDFEGTGIGIRNGYLYYGTRGEILRMKLEPGQMIPTADPETLVQLEAKRWHGEKPFTFDGKGNLYVNMGAPANACQQQPTTPGSPGLDPCPLLEENGGIWRFDENELGQTVASGYRYVTGVRNAVALTWDEEADALYFVAHGRDSLSGLWPEYYTDEMSAELPAEEMHKAVEGGNYGWPYAHWNHLTGERIMNPEYGGDGLKKAEDGLYIDPIFAAPGHWAPNDVHFYHDDAFPEFYQGGAFIAFHGSWNRAPLPQAGYKIVYVPFENGLPSGDSVTFADGFAGQTPLASPGDAAHRPMGIITGLEGELYVSDDQGGRIWRITYEGE